MNNELRLLIIGGGMVAEEFLANPNNIKIGSDYFRVKPFFTEEMTRNNLDAALLTLGLNINDFDGVVNCIGISDTRFCEDPKNWDEISFVNGTLPKHLSTFCKYYKTKFIHISTGCLYDQPHRPCTEDEPLAAHCNYVVSKWQGELGCDKTSDIIIRPRLLFGERHPPEGKRNNLICKLQKFDKFVDAFDSITWIGDIVRACDALVRRDCSGAYNVACKEVKTMHQIATEHLGLEGIKITPEELRRSQKLHLVNNVMDISKIESIIPMTNLDEALEHCCTKLGFKT